MNKKRILYIVAACTLSFAQMGCSDLLDQAPQGELIDTDLVGGTYESEIFGMYAAMRDFGNNRTCHPQLPFGRRGKRQYIDRRSGCRQDV